MYLKCLKRNKQLQWKKKKKKECIREQYNVISADWVRKNQLSGLYRVWQSALGVLVDETRDAIALDVADQGQQPGVEAAASTVSGTSCDSCQLADGDKRPRATAASFTCKFSC